MAGKDLFNKKIKRKLYSSLLLFFSILAGGTTYALAEETYGTFSISNDAYNISQYPLETYSTDIFESSTGLIMSIPSISLTKVLTSEIYSNPALIPIYNQNFEVFKDKSGYYYTFISWSQTNASQKLNKFPVSEVSWENRSSSPITLKYKQTSEVTKKWHVDGEISGSTKFQAKFIGNIEASLSISGGKENTAFKSTEIEATTNVPSNTLGYIKKYFPGGYGKGTSSWRRYSSGGTFLGTVKKNNDGYIVKENHEHFVSGNKPL